MNIEIIKFYSSLFPRCVSTEIEFCILEKRRIINMEKIVPIYKKLATPIWLKYSLSIQEAADYFGIGEKRLRQLVAENEGADFLLEIGSHIKIKRRRFEAYLDEAYAV